MRHLNISGILLSGSKKLFLIAIAFIILPSCKKYLDEKTSKSVVVPETLADLQAILNTDEYVNETPGLLETPVDDYYNPDPFGVGIQSEFDHYLWKPDANDFSAWRLPYQRPVYYSNVVLEQLKKIKIGPGETVLANRLKGSALFYRSFAFFNLAQLFCRPYSSTANTDLGIAVRLTAAIEVPTTRATVQQTYDQIINDLKTAASLLPETTQYPTRPVKAAVYGLLARVYLSMRDYPNARRFADSVLTDPRFNKLIDYNSLDPVAPFSLFNQEVIFYYFFQPPEITQNYYGVLADSILIRLYDNDDLRKAIFFKDFGYGGLCYDYASSYQGQQFPGFNGIATDEMYLIRAECAARANDKALALSTLDTLLLKRWVTGTYTPRMANTAQEALTLVVNERRKELVCRGLRWTDLRRYNLEGANITLKRDVNGTLYTLPPNDLKWVLLIPREVINLNSMPQNPR